MPLIVRVPQLIGAAGVIDSELDRYGFALEGETCTLYRDFAETRFAADPDVTIVPCADADWLAAIARLQRQSPAHAATYASVVDSIAIPAGFVSLRRDGAIVAVAYGVLHEQLLVCESVVVDEALRGQSLGRRMMHALFAWAADHGATAVCLQVAAENVAGRALYASLKLDTELYRYHYRRAV